MDEQLLLGLEQARDTMLPEILIRPLFKPFVEDELPALDPEHAGAGRASGRPRGMPPKHRPGGDAGVGPEGGFIPYEVEKFAGCGFTPVASAKEF